MNPETLYPILSITGIILLIVIIVKIKKAIRHSHSTCPSCKKAYSYPEDFSIIAGPLQWERKTKTEYKGDFKYEIEYQQFYRILTFDFKCSSFGYEHWFNKRINVWRSDSNYSQSDAEELQVLINGVRKQFDNTMFAGKDIIIYPSDEE